MEQLKEELELAESKGLFRELKTLGSSSGREIEFGGRKYINFSSNNYLDLASNPSVIEASKKAIDKYGAGGASSRLIAGTLEIHNQLEKSSLRSSTASPLLFFRADTRQIWGR